MVRDKFGVLEDGKTEPKTELGAVAFPMPEPISTGASGHHHGPATTFARLALDLDMEEKDLWKHLRRKRDFEARTAEKHASLVQLRERRRQTSIACAEVAASVEHLLHEVNFAKTQELEMEHDISVLKESNRILHSAFETSSTRHITHPGVSVPTNALEDPVGAEKERQVSIKHHHDQITHYRGHLQRLLNEKQELLKRQQALFDKQRAAEQDRNLLLSSLQEDRKSINDVRAERLKLWEERIQMEREMTTIVQEAHFSLPGSKQHGDASTLSRELARNRDIGGT
eukprot:CAMPEP_0178421578 /NCGR_PEP_ID=MMETSP0689_2-20121128/26718_1 /TAXON_ID=160604 /ORGANISM="Amphidinium massartii, Strain CS-259" /LENGTH=284 /DNA_ID=CAMNT_0020043091 /DNA_START=73 /DNA_END=924 /DNA_ORIENTATION=-